jgi:hypothetical protein
VSARGAGALLALVLAALLASGGAPDESGKAGGTAPVGPARRSSADPARAGFPAPARPGAAYDSTRGDSVGEAALYMAWGAPYGTPGARQNTTITGRDTNRVDTLYLSLETGRDLPRLFAMFGRVVVHPAPGDSLGAFWDFRGAGANRGGLQVQVDADGTFPCARPWLYPGGGGTTFEFAAGLGELLVVYAVTPEDAAPISGRTRYCFARLLLRHRRADLAGSGQPVCIEWREAGYSGGGEDLMVRRGPARFVSVNAPDGSVCAARRRAATVGAWRPAPARSPGPERPTRALADSARR